MRSWATTTTSPWPACCSRRSHHGRQSSGRPRLCLARSARVDRGERLTRRLPARAGWSGRALCATGWRWRAGLPGRPARAGAGGAADRRLLGVDPNAVDLFRRFAPPSAEHPLGTDELGRDLFLRLLYGGRVSLFVGIVGRAAAAVLGRADRPRRGLSRRPPRRVLMRLTDAVIALPLLPLLIVLAAVDLNKLGVPAELAHSETSRSTASSSSWRSPAGRRWRGWCAARRCR